MRAISRCLVRRSQPRRNWRRCISRRRRCSMGRSAERRKKIQTTSRTLNATGSEPARRGGPRAAALEPLAEKRDGVDLERPEQVPVDAARARVRRAGGDHLRGGDEEVDGQVVRQHGDPLDDHLEGVDGGQDRRRLAHLALFAQEPVLEVAVAAALAEPRAVAPDRDRAAHDQVDGPHLARRHRAPPAAGAGDARRERRLLAEALRVDLDEALLGAQPRHGPVENLAFGEGAPAPRGLRRAGVHLHHQRAPPHRHLAQELRGPFGAGEVGNAAEGPGESRRALALNRLPDLLADLRLRHREPAWSTWADATLGSPGSQLDPHPHRARAGARRRAKTRKPVWATMRCSGRTLRSRTCQKRTNVSSDSTAPKAPCWRKPSTACFTWSAVGTKAVTTAPGRSAAEAASRSRQGSARSTTSRSTWRSSSPAKASAVRSVQLGAGPW